MRIRGLWLSVAFALTMSGLTGAELAVASVPGGGGVFEVGRLSVGTSWVAVDLEGSFTDPVVVAGPASLVDTEPVTVRVRNVSVSGFELRLEEFGYQDGVHAAEDVAWLVVESGTHTLDSGAVVEAGTASADSTFTAVSFSATFAAAPVVATAVVSNVDTDATVVRVDGLTASGFEVALQEQEDSTGGHGSELVTWVAWSAGSDDGALDELAWEAASIGADETGATATFTQMYGESCVLASLNSHNDADVANVRLDNRGPSSVELLVTEEESADPEVDHAIESVGLVVIDCVEPPAPNPPQWEAGTVSVDDEWLSVPIGGAFTESGGGGGPGRGDRR